MSMFALSLNCKATSTAVFLYDIVSRLSYRRLTVKCRLKSNAAISCLSIIIVSILAGLPPTLSTSFGEELSLSSKWGGYGIDSGRFKSPQGLAIDPSGNVYVTDTSNHRIQKFSSDGKFITKWGSFGVLEGEFNGPNGIAMDGEENLYVVDTANSRIQKFSKTGQFLASMGGYGVSDGRFKLPRDLALDSAGTIYLVDSGNNRIQVFSGNGTFLTKWGGFGTNDGRFIHPTGITLDHEGNVFVLDSGNNRVQKFSNNGTLLSKWGSYGVLDGQLRFSSDMISDRSGNIYLSDSLNNRILIYSADPLQEYYDDVNYDLYSTPFVIDQTLRAEVVYEGLQAPTSMSFLGSNEILVLQKGIPEVRRIVNGAMLEEPLLEIDVGRVITCMCGVTVDRDGDRTFVFLNYYTIGKELPNAEAVGIRVIRYELSEGRLVDPKLLLYVPSAETAIHLGGKVIIGPDENLYIPTGDINGQRTVAQNVGSGPEADLTSAILRITKDGEAVPEGILGQSDPLNKYYAYGIRNSFGLAFDPVTGMLWDTENGPEYGDEINLVEPGFNSGWRVVHGASINKQGFELSSLVDFQGKGNYSDPEFEWRFPVGPTDLTFLSSNRLGEQYENDMFVGDINNGYIYHFDLNNDRTGLLLTGSLADKMADNINESKEAVFGFGFGGITDLQVGPDGYLYILSFTHGKIYRIVPQG